MSLLREIANKGSDEAEAPEKEAPAKETPSDSNQPVEPEGGWNVGHLAHHGILLSCDGFSLKLDIEELNKLFDLAEDGETGEVRDHAGNLVTVEVTDDSIVLSRNDDKVYPNGVILDETTLKEMGIERYLDDGAEAAEQDDEGGQPDEGDEGEPADDTMSSDSDEVDELEEGIKKAFRRSGKKIKRGWRVTSGFRKGRVVSSPKAAFKPRKKASTRMKLRIAGRKKRLIRILKARRTRRKSLSKRLRRLNKT